MSSVLKKLAVTFLSGLIVLVSFTVGQASAQSPTPRGAKIRSEIRDQVQERKQELRENLCDRVQTRIQERRDHYGQLKDRHVNIYRGVVHRLRNLVEKLTNRGCDASQVEADLAQFEALIDELSASFNLFLGQLHSVGIPVCQEEPGDWKEAMGEVRDQLQAAKTKHREIRNFYKNTLKPHVRAAGQACRVSNSPTPEATPNE